MCVPGFGRRNCLRSGGALLLHWCLGRRIACPYVISYGLIEVESLRLLTTTGIASQLSRDKIGGPFFVARLPVLSFNAYANHTTPFLVAHTFLHYKSILMVYYCI